MSPNDPPSIRRAMIVAGLAAAMTATVLGFASGLATGDATAHRRTATVPSTLPSAPPPATGPTVRLVPKAVVAVAGGDGAALLKRLAAPAGIETFTITDSTDGVMDFDQYLDTYSNPDGERAMLRGFGWDSAVSNAWLRADGTRVQTILVQFRSAAGARDFFDQQDAAYTRDPQVGDAWPIHGVPRAHVYQKPDFDKDGDRETILTAQDGPIFVVLFLDSAYPPSWATAVGLLQRQIDALSR